MWKLSVCDLTFPIKSLGSLGFNKSNALLKLDLRKFKEFFAPTILANFIKLDIFKGPVIPTCTGTLFLDLYRIYLDYLQDVLLFLFSFFQNNLFLKVEMNYQIFQLDLCHHQLLKLV